LLIPETSIKNNFESLKKGKSSIILRYTDRGNEIPKPTIALDYTFCRKAKSGSSVVTNDKE